jgi:Cof subfamily protein (haloacid dehalogenase superfamily)
MIRRQAALASFQLATQVLQIVALASDVIWTVEAFLISYCANSPSTLPRSTSTWFLSASSPRIDDDDDDGDTVTTNPPKWNPDIPMSNSKGHPNKLDVYGEDELASLLDIHQQLYPVTSKSSLLSTKASQPSPIPCDQRSESSFLGIHDMIVETVKELELGIKVQQQESLSTWLPEKVVEKCKNIRAIASDVDGTITGSDQSVHPRTQSAIRRAIEASYSPVHQLKVFFPATGKSKAGALATLPPDLALLLSQGPGVFIQGLYCINGDKVIFEKKLSISAVAAAERLVAESDTCVIAYDGDTLWTNNLTDTVKELHEIWKEPLSREIAVLADYPHSFHKILICDYDLDKLKLVRRSLEKLAKENDCVVTQAIPTMLELLPSGCSKAVGVQKLCEELGIDPSTELLALGDAENDVDMLKMAAIGCAVENANDLAKNAADVVLPLSSTSGGAGLAMEVIGGV